MQREMRVWRSLASPIVVATDGRLDDEAPPSVAYLLVDPVSGSRRAAAAVVPESILRELEPRRRRQQHLRLSSALQT